LTVESSVDRVSDAPEADVVAVFVAGGNLFHSIRCKAAFAVIQLSSFLRLSFVKFDSELSVLAGLVSLLLVEDR
jgi:hypothetical protein